MNSYNKTCRELTYAEKNGPGCWRMMHRLAYFAKDYGEKLFCIRYIRLLSTHFGCETCENHMKQFFKENPPENNIDDLFAWTVNFHNAVNIRLGKEIMTVQQAKNYYSDDFKPCSTECMITPVENNDKNIPVKYVKK